ncbi:MAG: hypothetical protein F7B17_00525 [Desulfurococcales archaeon]|nr:hypothetical protein [Desulfurococcales archaeon]
MLYRVVTVRLRVPKWVSDEEVERIVRDIEETLENSVPISALREMLDVKENELVDRLEPIDWQELEEKEKERLRRLYES